MIQEIIIKNFIYNFILYFRLSSSFKYDERCPPVIYIEHFSMNRIIHLFYKYREKNERKFKKSYLFVHGLYCHIAHASIERVFILFIVKKTLDISCTLYGRRLTVWAFIKRIEMQFPLCP